MGVVGLPVDTPMLIPTAVPMQSVQLQVAFTSQAPKGQWSDERFQDACEEASALMAIGWVNGTQILEPEVVTRKIESIAAFQEEKFGGFVDTSVADTVERIFKQYYAYGRVEAKPVANMEAIVRELVMGHLVIVPTDGQKLGNPNFINGGPERHNLVITGYDLEKKQFVTNDPGTRKGKDYRYDQEVLFAAIRDYPSGDHEPIEKIEKRMIVVRK